MYLFGRAGGIATVAAWRAGVLKGATVLGPEYDRQHVGVCPNLPLARS